MAYAAALFADAVLRGLNGAPATECTYVESDVTDVPFFATKCKLGTEGACAAQHEGCSSGCLRHSAARARARGMCF
jgi:hypothetical protein